MTTNHINEIPLILKVLSSFFFFFSGLLWKTILPKNINYELIFYRTIFSIIFLIIPIIILSLSHGYFSFSPFLHNGYKELFYSISICFFSFFGLYYFTYALQKGRFVMVLPLSSLTSIFAIISAFIFFSQIPSTAQLSACMIIILGIGIHQYNRIKRFKLDKEILFALLFTFFWGVSFTLYLIPIGFFGPVNFTLILELTVLVSAWLLIIKKGNKILPSKIDQKTFFSCVLIGLCVAGGSLFSNIALSEVSVVINVLISLIFEGIVILFGIRYLKEDIGFKDWILIFCVTISSILVMF